VGLIPVILWIVPVFLASGVSVQGSSPSGLAAVLLGLFGFAQIAYVVELVVTIICLVNKRSRLFGYGLLTMMFIAPVVAAASCTIARSLH
jgi:hypothetical protein